jgi:hypothetical protein
MNLRPGGLLDARATAALQRALACARNPAAWRQLGVRFAGGDLFGGAQAAVRRQIRSWKGSPGA